MFWLRFTRAKVPGNTVRLSEASIYFLVKYHGNFFLFTMYYVTEKQCFGFGSWSGFDPDSIGSLFLARQTGPTKKEKNEVANFAVLDVHF
jgi:hypothetical protein